MIGLDSNVLLRLLLNDEPVQSAQSKALVLAHGKTPGSLRLCDTVILETLWTLASHYRLPRSQISTALERLLAEPAFAVSDATKLAQVLHHYSNSNADIGDAFIAVDNASSGCTHTATFDTATQTLPGMVGVAKLL